MRIITHIFAAGGTIDYNIGGRYLRLIATGAPVDVTPLEAGRELTEEKATAVEAGFATRPLDGFDGFRLTSSVAQTVRIAVTSGSGSYDRTSGDVNVIGTVPVTGALTNAELRASAVPISGTVSGPLTDAQLRATPPEVREIVRATGNYTTEGATAANNTPYTVFTPAANTNGAIVWTANACTSNSGNPPVIALLDHTATPAAITDGRALALTGAGAGYSTGSLFGALQLVRPVFIPAGRGLFFFFRFTDSFGYRAALFSLL